MKKIITFILSAAICLSIPIQCCAEENSENKNENINAKAVVLMSIDTGEVLYQENEYEHLSPASVTKIMSILLMLEALDNGDIALTDTVTASKDAVSMGGSQIWLEVGEQMTVEELLKAVVVASANDACTALGEFIGGSTTGFVKMMNDRAAELGLANTNFENCTGLDDTVKNHYSCAYDLALIASEVMKHDIITDYTTIWLDSLRNGETELNNTNKLVNTYEGITGLKTGTTSNAGFCVAATACRDNMNLVAVVLGADTSDERFDTASYLLDWGFANYQVITPEIDDSKITPVKVINGVFKELTPDIGSTSKIVVKKGTEDISYKYVINESVNAPVKKGDKVGEIKILSNKKEIGTIKLVSPNSIAQVTLKTIWHNIMINI
ncbi:MAG: D-alanyl-D-alanine carboxypeptidase family protein [Eubacterium sp.]